MVAVQLMSASILPVSCSSNVEQVLKKMYQYQVKHLPVMDETGTRFMGLIAEEQIVDKSPDSCVCEPGEELLLIGVGPDQHLLDVVHFLSHNELSILPVYSTEKYFGCIRRQDAFTILGKSVAFEPRGSIIEIWVQSRNYSLAEISRIVESENIKILSAIIQENDLINDKIKIILKVDNDQIDSILAAFERFGYDVAASYSESHDYLSMLRERYESLMHYLNA